MLERLEGADRPGELAALLDVLDGQVEAALREAKLLGESPALRAYVERMYARPRAPQRIADIFGVMRREALRS